MDGRKEGKKEELRDEKKEDIWRKVGNEGVGKCMLYSNVIPSRMIE